MDVACLMLCACRRSGWQPPKDTGLWEVSARVGDAIQQQMTAAQQEYWAGENGYFSQVRAGQVTVLADGCLGLPMNPLLAPLIANVLCAALE